jgi:CheY-like chemotaxis protein
MNARLGDGFTESARREETAMGGGETVLVVEDEPDVRMLVVEVLGILGYTALEAAEATAALALLGGDQRIDLMISDVGLPGMNGRELATRARELRKDLAVLLITGYSAEATDRAGFLGPGLQMMTKPFQIEQLSSKIRQMLESRPGHGQR